MEETKDKKKETGNSLRGYWDDLVKHWEPGPVSLPSHESVKCYKLLSNSTLESDSDVKKKKKIILISFQGFHEVAGVLTALILFARKTVVVAG